MKKSFITKGLCTLEGYDGMGNSISPEYRDPHADTHSMQNINTMHDG